MIDRCIERKVTENVKDPKSPGEASDRSIDQLEIQNLLDINKRQEILKSRGRVPDA